MGEFSEFKVEVDFPGVGADAKSGCPTLSSSVSATVNGQNMNVVRRGGAVDCPSLAGTPCRSCAGLSFQLDRAWDAAKSDGLVEISIADGSYRIVVTASGALLPNAISLSPPATVMVSQGDLLALNVASRTPPLSTLHFMLIEHSGQFMIVEMDLGTKSTIGGGAVVSLPVGLATDLYQLQAKSDATTSPQVETCEGVASCSVGPTNLVGSVDLNIL